MLLFRLFISGGDQGKLLSVYSSLSDHFGIFYVLSQFGFFRTLCFRLDELRHRLIPLYTYDPAEEQDDWGDADKDNEEEELAVSKPLKLIIYFHVPSHTRVVMKISTDPECVFLYRNLCTRRGSSPFHPPMECEEEIKKERRMCPIRGRCPPLYFVLQVPCKHGLAAS